MTRRALNLPSDDRLETPMRLMAATFAVAGTALLHAVPVAASGTTGQAILFFLIFAIAAAFILVARGLGSGIGSGLGLIIGASIGITLAQDYQHAALGSATFMLVATVMMVLVGRISGGSDRRESPRTQKSQTDRTIATDDIVSGLIGDFMAWCGTPAAQELRDNKLRLQSFERFLRGTLTDRIDAEDTRIEFAPSRFEANATDNESDQSDADRSESDSLTHLVHQAFEDGGVHVHLAPQAGSRERVHWILPLRRENQADVVVVIAQPDCAMKSCARATHAVRDVLELFWSHLSSTGITLNSAPTAGSKSGTQSTRQGRKAFQPTAAPDLAMEPTS